MIKAQLDTANKTQARILEENNDLYLEKHKLGESNYALKLEYEKTNRLVTDLKDEFADLKIRFNVKEKEVAK